MALENAIPDEHFLARARALHEKVFVIDTHCDTTQRLRDPRWNPTLRHDTGHVDIPKLREGGVDAVFFAVWAPGPMEPGLAPPLARAQIQRIQDLVRRYESDFAPARSADEIRQARADHRIAVPIAIEGGYLIDDSLDVLHEYHRCGATYLTLTHGFHTTWADSSGIHEDLTPRHGGLTDFGKAVVRELNGLGMMVDVSHVSDTTFWQVIELSSAPVVATHSSCRAISPHRRNLSDDMMRAIAQTGGVVQINFAAGFIDPDHPPLDPDAVEKYFANPNGRQTSLTDHVTPRSILVDHFDHALQTIGPDHVGIGSDFDGVPTLPQGVEDCSKLPYITADLLRRGYREVDLEKVLGANVLRVMDACQEQAK